MNEAGAFTKGHWITFCIFLGLVLLYAYVTENKLMNPYLFPSADAIKRAFISGRGVMTGNILASLKLLAPLMTVSLLITLFLGAIMRMSTRVREVLHPVIYAFSIIPSILLFPFVLLMAPSLFSMSVLPTVHNIMWATLPATITDIMTINERYLDETATSELQGFKRLIKVIPPAANPFVLVGFVNSLCSSFIMLVLAETYGVGRDMGYFVKKYAELGIFANAWVDFILMVIILVIVVQIFKPLKKHLPKWTIDQRDPAENQRQLGRRSEKIRPV